MARLVAAYPNLFGNPAETGEEKPVEEDNWFTKRYGWLATVDSVAKDRTQWDYFLMMPIVEFLNYLCYLHDKAEYENQKKNGLD